MNRKQYILEQVKKNEKSISGMDALHLGLDAAGILPGIGIFADLANAALYYGKGQKGMAALSLGAAVPVAGIAVGGAKLAGSGAKLAGKAMPTFAKGVKAVTPTLPTSKATKALSPRMTRAKAKTEVRRAREYQANIAKQSPTIGPPTARAAALKAGADEALEVAKKSRRAARAGLEAAAKRADRTAMGSRLVKGAATLAGSRRFGLGRAGALGREEIGAATGMDMGDSQAFRYEGGKALVDKTVSGISDALRNLPDVQQSVRTALKPLEDYKLGTFKS